MSRSLVWLGLTPEPERELPAAVAVLRGGSETAERQRISKLLLHGTQRQWLRYLDEVAELALAAQPGTQAAKHVKAIVLEHHRMLIGLRGNAYVATENMRERLGGGDEN
ncbi:hypothetical protein [Catelliglobosispora koreensis]|uniref:hypothetical protein n=1 Tax=Catelliglobosispora koreensis TaxID=129052 RepID=UPI000377D999|nr:hypothetical protein [Catelliglobosispora koreensis]